MVSVYTSTLIDAFMWLGTVLVLVDVVSSLSGDSLKQVSWLRICRLVIVESVRSGVPNSVARARPSGLEFSIPSGPKSPSGLEHQFERLSETKRVRSRKV